jgi:hypothetical protein
MLSIHSRVQELLHKVGVVLPNLIVKRPDMPRGLVLCNNVVGAADTDACIKRAFVASTMLNAYVGEVQSFK